MPEKRRIDVSGKKKAFREAVSRRSIEPAVVIVSLIFGCGVAMMNYVTKDYVYCHFARSRLPQYVSTEGTIDSLRISYYSGENEAHIDDESFSIDYLIRYSVGNADFVTRYTQEVDSQGVEFTDLETVWEAIQSRAPGQSIRGSYLGRSECEFLSGKYLRSEINAPIEVRYDPAHPERNDWVLKEREKHGALRLFLPLFLLIPVGGSLYAVMRYRSRFSRLLNLGAVILIGFVWRPPFDEIKAAFERAFPGTADRPYMNIQYDERLDPNVCKVIP